MAIGSNGMFVDEQDDQVDPLGIRGIDEIGITGVAAAAPNAF